MHKHLVLLVTFLSLASSLAYAGFDEGKAAYDRGDYTTAYKEFKVLAERGKSEAQYYLGIMYEYGRGVPEDDTEAVKWYRKAAEQGNRFAQLSLGIMYDFGTGVPQDYVMAHMWLNLAAAQGSSGARTVRDKLAQQMTSAQIAEAQRLARESKPKGND